MKHFRTFIYFPLQPLLILCRILQSFPPCPQATCMNERRSPTIYHHWNRRLGARRRIQIVLRRSFSSTPICGWIMKQLKQNYVLSLPVLSGWPRSQSPLPLTMTRLSKIDSMSNCQGVVQLLSLIFSAVFSKDYNRIALHYLPFLRGISSLWRVHSLATLRCRVEEPFPPVSQPSV